MRRACQRTLVALPLVFLLASGDAEGQSRVTTPEQHFGHAIGSDYWLPDYTAFQAYWQKLAGESDRMVLDTIGTTAEGRPQLMAIITSPENHTRLDRYREIARQLARAEGLTDEQARALAREGKAIVWFDGGLHATEVLGASQLTETVYQLLSRDDEETLRFLDDLIILAVHANPDGMELVADWYMREPVPEKRSTSGVPRLYQKYVGHDNNRDFYMSTQPETENMNRVMFTEWFPQIVYNHHQTGPAGTVMFAPPFRDPFNYNLHPLIPAGLDMIGGAMMTRFVAEDKPGITNRLGANYSTWWNGGLRTITYYHNMYGLLTETIGNPTPIEIPLIARRQLASNDLPYPIEPQVWHFRNSIDYSVTANYAVFDIASRRREQFLYNIYVMGRDAIEEGSRDTWTTWPREIATLDESLRDGGRENGNGFRGGATGSPADFERHLRRPEDREPRGYILPSDQPDFQTAGKLIEALLENGIIVHRATSDFTVNGKQYPSGSYVIKTAQSFRPHIIDMFEPQDHPDDIPYPGGPPTPPYDVAGWTLAYQMGVDFDRILDGFDGPFERITGLDAPRVAGRVEDARAGWFLSHEVNDAFTAVSRLLAGDQRVYWLTQPVSVDGTTWPAGTFWIPARGNARRIIDTAARDLGLVFEGAQQAPASSALQLREPRIALVDRYGGSMPSGWTRWIFEQFEMPHTVVYPQELDAGNLHRKYDVIVFVDGLVPQSDQAGGSRGFGSFDESTVPAEFRSWLGSVTVEKTVPQLRSFLQNGGTILTIGSSTALAQHLGLPVASALVENVNGTEQELPRSKFYVPNSLLEVAVTEEHPLAHGMDERAIVVYDNSPVFRITGDGVTPIARYDSATPLRSGWAWGQQYLENGVAIAEAQVGEGKLFLFGPEIVFRAQPHGTFKFLFNGIYYGTAEEARLR
ncbi:MAG TPA: M14 metallopeptidase family protein [Longimicrobiales bacterium]|nr:M14 metallopeptidase family protein [Longimicrobiales bacterium]